MDQVDSEIGFSLIELLVVIGIIGILASIAVPQVRNYLRKAALAHTASDF